MGVTVGVPVEVPVAVGVGVPVGVGVKVGLSVEVGMGVCVAVLVDVGVSVGAFVLVGVSVGIGVDVPVGVSTGMAVMTTTMGAGVGSGVAKKRLISSLVMPANTMTATIPAVATNPQSTNLPQPPPSSYLAVALGRLPEPPSEVAVATERERHLPSLHSAHVHAGGCPS